MISLIFRFTGTCSSLISWRPFGCCSFHIHCFPITYTSSVSFGAVRKFTYTTAPHANIPSARISGITVQPIVTFDLLSYLAGPLPPVFHSSNDDQKRHQRAEKHRRNQDKREQLIHI